jgi:hypothetical protein
VSETVIEMGRRRKDSPTICGPSTIVVKSCEAMGIPVRVSVGALEFIASLCDEKIANGG